MTTFEILILGVVVVCVFGFVAVCWKLTSAVVGLTENALRESGREKLDEDRLTAQLVAKMMASKESQEHLDHLHAQEAVNKWRMSEKTEQIKAASKHGQAQAVAEPGKPEPEGVGPGEADAYT